LIVLGVCGWAGAAPVVAPTVLTGKVPVPTTVFEAAALLQSSLPPAASR
jgi:hypothetical protein